MYDPELYRTKEEVEEWKQRDPIAALEGTLKAIGALSDPIQQDLEAATLREIDEAVAFAEAGSWEPVEELGRFVYLEGRTP
jgi:TPP-dependent pyruvate/acetoin dehydrogenase alpha subunit